jgi:hypothetical protein
MLAYEVRGETRPGGEETGVNDFGPGTKDGTKAGVVQARH